MKNEKDLIIAEAYDSGYFDARQEAKHEIKKLEAKRKYWENKYKRLAEKND